MRQGNEAHAADPRGATAAGIAVVAVVMTWVLLGAPATALGRGPSAWSPPTAAAVADPFRLPFGPYGPGNRGLEYATDPGDPLAAPADGVVGFVGHVAGRLFVSVDHPGGVRSTLGGLQAVTVGEGDRVRRGDPLALAGGPTHFSVRIRGNYVDPADLFGRWALRAVLVPVEGGGTLPPYRYTPVRPVRASARATPVRPID